MTRAAGRGGSLECESREVPGAPAGHKRRQSGHPGQASSPGVARGPGQAGRQMGRQAGDGGPPTLSAAEGRASLAGFPDPTLGRQGQRGSPTSSDVFGPWTRAPCKTRTPEGHRPRSRPGGWHLHPGSRLWEGGRLGAGPRSCVPAHGGLPGAQVRGQEGPPGTLAGGPLPGAQLSRPARRSRPPTLPPAPGAPLPSPHPVCPPSLCR